MTIDITTLTTFVAGCPTCGADFTAYALAGDPKPDGKLRCPKCRDPHVLEQFHRIRGPKSLPKLIVAIDELHKVKEKSVLADEGNL